MVILSITLVTFSGLYEPGWSEPCVKVGVKLLQPFFVLRLTAQSDTMGCGGNGRVFRFHSNLRGQLITEAKHLYAAD